MLPTPRLPLSARLAAGFLIALLLLTVVALAFPEAVPRLVKEPICILWMLPGAPLAVLLANDLARLRQLRLLLRHATEVPRDDVEGGAPTPLPGQDTGLDHDEDSGDDEDDEDEDELPDDVPELRIDQEGVAAALVARWRGWRKWLLGIAVLTVAVHFAFGPWWMAVALYLLAPAVLREIYLAINALEEATPAAWRSLHPLERALARAEAALLGGSVLVGMVGALAWVVYRLCFDSGNVHFKPGHIGVALLWLSAFAAGVHFVQRMAWIVLRRAARGAAEDARR
jgi:hypothetical protein